MSPATLEQSEKYPKLMPQRDFLGRLNAAGIVPYKLKCEEAEAEIAWLSSPLIQFHRGISIAEVEGAKSRSAQSLYPRVLAFNDVAISMRKIVNAVPLRMTLSPFSSQPTNPPLFEA